MIEEAADNMAYSLRLFNNEIVLGLFSKNFEEDKEKILAKAEKLFSSGKIFFDKEKGPFSLQRVICDDTKYHYPLRTEYAPLEIKDEGGRISMSVIGPFSTDKPKIDSK